MNKLLKFLNVGLFQLIFTVCIDIAAGCTLILAPELAPVGIFCLSPMTMVLIRDEEDRDVFRMRSMLCSGITVISALIGGVVGILIHSVG